MPRPYTLYKDGKTQRNVYASDLEAWEKNGWSLKPSSIPQDRPLEDDTVPEPITSPELLDINTATSEQISEALNGIGPSRAKKIVVKRDSLVEGFLTLDEIPFLEDEHKPLIKL